MILYEKEKKKPCYSYLMKHQLNENLQFNRITVGQGGLCLVPNIDFLK
jgi:hypothetical protein